MAQGYGKLGGRRRGSGAWQWLIIGFFPGLLCGGVVIFGLLLTGTLGDLTFGEEPTPIVETQVVAVVYTPTTDPNQPTNTPYVVTATPEGDEESAPNAASSTDDETGSDSGVVVVAPSATPTQDPDAISATETAAAETGNDSDNGSAQQPNSPDDVDDVEESIAPDVPAPSVPEAASNDAIPEALSGIPTRLITIEGGTFQMGTTANEVLEAVDQCVVRDQGNCLPEYGEDANPPFQAQVDTFQIEATEVTFGQYVAFLNYLSSQGVNHRSGCSGFLCIQTVNENDVSGVITFDSANYSVPQSLLDYPVYAVTWYGAQAYCEAIGRRLPTEAEWELAARGTQGRLYPWGNEWSNDLAKTNRPEDAPPGPVPVGTYPGGATPNGVLDMAGNVGEWVQDWYSPTIYTEYANQPQPVVNPTGPPVALTKVLRGGHWNAVPFFARSVHRQELEPVPDNINDTYARWVGFRCAADAGAGSSTAGTGSSNTNTDPNALGSGLGDNTGDSTDNAQPTLPSAPPEAESEDTGGSGNRG